MKPLKLGVILLINFTIFGCSSTNIKKPYSPFSKEEKYKPGNHIKENYFSPKATPPNWIDHTPNNDNLYIYGVGSGNSYDKSVKSALADMAQRLQVSISANTSLQTISHSNNISQKLIQQISTTTDQINIPNYTIINQDNSNGIYYIQLQANIKETIRSLHKTIKNSILESQLLLSSAENKNSLTRFNIAKQVDANLIKIKSSLRSLLILEPNIDIANYMESLNNVDNQNLNLKRSISIYINESDSGYFYETLKKYIYVSSFNIKNKSTANLDFTLKLVDYNTSNIAGNYCINTKVELQIQDSLSNQLHTQTFDIKTCSTKGRDSAINKACDKFYSKLNKNMDN